MSFFDEKVSVQAQVYLAGADLQSLYQQGTTRVLAHLALDGMLVHNLPSFCCQVYLIISWYLSNTRVSRSGAVSCLQNQRDSGDLTDWNHRPSDGKEDVLSSMNLLASVQGEIICSANYTTRLLCSRARRGEGRGGEVTTCQHSSHRATCPFLYFLHGHKRMVLGLVPVQLNSRAWV